MPPAARVGDMATCVGPPDVIAGSVHRLDRRPTGGEADRYDITVHGGVITAPGCPTVLIG
jgi:hypothetical protein